MADPTTKGDGRVQMAYLHPHVVSHSWHESMMRLVAYDAAHHGRVVATGGPFMIRCDAGGLVEARNLGVARFLDETQHEWLFWVDTDMGFMPDAIDRLVDAADPADRPVMGGLCFGLREFRYDGYGGRRVLPAPTLYRWARTPAGHIGFTTRWDVPDNQVTRVDGTGAAFLLIHRRVLQEIRAAHGDVWFDQVRYGDGRLVSEDLSFCWRLHQIGASVHVHTGVKTTHHKQFWVGAEDYRPPPPEMLAAATADLVDEPGPAAGEQLSSGGTDVIGDPLPATVTDWPRVPAGEPRISLLCPTRGRPTSMRRLVESCDRYAAGPVEIMFYLDADDQPSIAMAQQLAAARGGGIVPLVGPRILLSAMWNECAKWAGADILMHCGDDIVFRTPRWDDLVVEAFQQAPDRLVFVHGDDLLQRGHLGTHGFLHRAWVDAVGYFVPPYFSSDWNDVWLTEVADAIGRRVYLPDLVTEHLHPVAGKADWDRTHRERVARGAADKVGELYASKADERAADAAVLRAAIREFAAVPA